jgi:hypothetical protein
MHKYLKKLFLVAVVATPVYAQEQPQFEVATVKLLPPVPSGTPLPVNLGSFHNGTAMLTNTTLSECLQFAHGLVSDAQIAGPDWIKTRDVRFDIVGKTGPEVSRDQGLAHDAKSTGRTVEAVPASRTEGNVVPGPCCSKEGHKARACQNGHASSTNSFANPWAGSSSSDADGGTGYLAFEIRAAACD